MGIKEIIENTNKPIKYTYGLKYRRPTTYMVDITKAQALDILNRGNYAHYDFEEHEDYIDLNLFSANDMW